MQYSLFVGNFHFRLVVLLFSLFYIFTLHAQIRHESRSAFANPKTYFHSYPRENYSRGVLFGSVTSTDHNSNLHFNRNQNENVSVLVSASQYKNSFNQMESWVSARQGVINAPYSTVGENAGVMKDISQNVENLEKFETSMPFKMSERKETGQTYWDMSSYLAPQEHKKETEYSLGHSVPASDENGKNDKIVFLDDRFMPNKKDKVDFIPKFGNESPSCANGTTFCEELDYYPKKYISDVFKKKMSLSLYKNIFDYDPKYEEGIEILNRLDREEELCQYDERIVFPQTARTVDNQWKLIANTDEVKQGFRVEICKNPEGSCAFADSFPLGYKIKCKQKYITRKLWSLSDGGEISEEYFYFPSCCTCSVGHIGDVDDYA